MTLVQPPPSQKRCLVHCGPRCTCERRAGGLRSMEMANETARQKTELLREVLKLPRVGFSYKPPSK